MKTPHLISLLFLVLHFVSFAQQDIKFTRISINEGLSLSSVYCMMQDSEGYIWIGTEDGLNRYNGYTFDIFRPEQEDENSISEKWIKSLFEDSYGYIWIVTENGLNRYDPVRETFMRFLHDKKPGSISNNMVTSIFEDSKRNIWVGTRDGLNLFNTNTYSFKSIEIERNITSNYITQIEEDILGNIWIGTQKGVLVYNPLTDEFKTEPLKNTNQNTEIRALLCEKDLMWVGTANGLYCYRQGEEKLEAVNLRIGKKDNHSIRSLFLDSRENIWIGTDWGFSVYDKVSETLTKIVTDVQSESNSLIRIERPIIEDNKGIIWMGSFGAGLFRYDPKTEIADRFVNDPLNTRSISENGVNTIMQDKYGVLWFGTFGAGLNKFDPTSNKFTLYTHDPNNKNSISENFIWSICEDREGCVWIGTNSHGLDKLDPKSMKFNHFSFKGKGAVNLAHNSVREIYEDSKGCIWFGTDGGGLYKYEKEKSKILCFKHNPQNTESLSSNSVRVIYEDSKGNLWIGTTNGLNRYIPDRNRFVRYQHDPVNKKTISHNFVYSSIYEDKNGFIWVGTYGGGLNRFDPETQEFVHFMNDPSDPNSISDNKVFSIVEDFKGRLWIGTNAGLDLFLPSVGKFKHKYTSDGLPNNTIYGILPEKNKKIFWLTTNFGMSRFDIEQGTFKNYYTDDGLQSTEFNGGAFHAGASGYMYVAGVNGLNVFHPDSIKKNTVPPDVAILNFSIFVDQVHIFKGKNSAFNDANETEILRKNDLYIISKNINYFDEIVLSYKEKVISFEFAGLHYANPQKNSYAYRLKGFEEEWNKVGDRRFVSYTNLNHGSYLFQIKAANCDGVWSEKVKTLKLTITPPIWKEWWFRIMVLVIVLGFIFMFIKWRERQLIQQKKILEDTVAERTAELVNRGEELKRQRDMISEQNRQITDSINYAQKIQQAVMPDEKIISAILDEYFILFKPFGIISGDFYWFKQINQYTFVAAVDCTGHGVPGAMMSMLGTSFLNEIVTHQHIQETGQVLDAMRDKIKESLKQKGKPGEQKDGMDMAFYVIDNETLEMQYSGAYNPLYIIRPQNNGTGKLTPQFHELKANRQPISVFKQETNFTTIRFQLQKGDCIYAMSDGYIDQFGGETGHKFLSKNFKKLLLSIYDKPMEEQKQVLCDNFYKWKGDYRQIDDILVIGIRV